MSFVYALFTEKNADQARRLIDLLDRSGVAVRSQRDLKTSSTEERRSVSIWNHIERDAEKADCVILFASQHLSEAHRLWQIAQNAFERDKLLIVLLEKDPSMPRAFGTTRVIDFSDWFSSGSSDWYSGRNGSVLDELLASIASLRQAAADEQSSTSTFWRIEQEDYEAKILAAELELRRRNERLKAETDQQAIEREAPRRFANRVTLSCFSPRSFRPLQSFLVQCYLHLPEETEVIRREARERDPVSRRAGSQPMGFAAFVNDRIRVILEADGLFIRDPSQEMRWQGAYVGIAFEVRTPFLMFSSREYRLKASVEINGAPAGCLSFVITVSPGAETTAAEPVPGYEPYRYVFMSYSSEDRAVVEEKARVLRTLGIPYFFDVETLRSGDDWKKKLKEHVHQADMFMLFWSPAAAKSKWVEQEAMWAVERQKASPTAEPSIKPYKISDSCPAPPAKLRHLHFESA